MPEDDLIGRLADDAVDQVLQAFGFLAVETGVVYFHDVLHMPGSDDELVELQKGKEFLVIAARIHHGTQFSVWKDPTASCE